MFVILTSFSANDRCKKVLIIAFVRLATKHCRTFVQVIFRERTRAMVRNWWRKPYFSVCWLVCWLCVSSHRGLIAKMCAVHWTRWRRCFLITQRAARFWHRCRCATRSFVVLRSTSLNRQTLSLQKESSDQKVMLTVYARFVFFICVCFCVAIVIVVLEVSVERVLRMCVTTRFGC